ncbi:B3 domain-containing protein Os06g0194400-like [Phalaenopsis equestris]|uniref:B3 domain-containing protein Os06g0194400-like n=1 Tax=Phalaenopsis equestris TaxID=78828 RepID=UPI0009E3600F|nr:B3 domain-containing protein Os06g0194400-like [Phalaenopsis equestris]
MDDEEGPEGGIAGQRRGKLRFGARKEGSHEKKAEKERSGRALRAGCIAQKVCCLERKLRAEGGHRIAERKNIPSLAPVKAASKGISSACLIGKGIEGCCIGKGRSKLFARQMGSRERTDGDGGGGGGGVTYEEVRRRKLEENKKKLEELNLGHLTIALREAVSPKTSPAKPLKRKAQSLPGQFVIRRRSDRIANLPEQSYKEVPSFEIIVRPRRVFRRTDLANRVYASDEAREYATEKALELQSQLDPTHPSFVKPMLISHVTGGFWLGLSKQFCTSHLPNRDTWFTLIDEDDEETQTLYLAPKTGLSAGWRGFSIAHELVDGDALVFHLIKPTAFKVYIIRCSGFDDSS